MGSKVESRNFGVFDVKITKARVGRNPSHPLSELKESTLQFTCKIIASDHFQTMNLPEKIQKLVRDATFKIHLKSGASGQCVLVDNSFIITAAHCVEWKFPWIALRPEHHLSDIKTPHDDFKAMTFAVEPVSDIAVLGSPLPQIHYFENEDFDRICEPIIPLQLMQKIPADLEEFPVWIWTHHNTWVKGVARYSQRAIFGCAIFSYTTDFPIEAGTSGGPIVNREGELVGVVSNGTTDCAAGFLPLALPAWILKEIARTN